MKLGIDIGRVLIAPDSPNGRADTSFLGGSLEAALATPPYEGMFDAVPQLVQLFDKRVWLVSKAGPRVQEKTRLWLKHHLFFERTGIHTNNIRFCLERSQKAGHCLELGITHFIDDRPDVLRHLESIVPNRYLFGPQKPNAERVPGIVSVVSWSAARSALTSAVREAA